jgi:hypothetical protein
MIYFMKGKTPGSFTPKLPLNRWFTNRRFTNRWFINLLYVSVLLLSGCISSGPAPSDADGFPSNKKEDSPEETTANSSEPLVDLPASEWTVKNLKQLKARINFSEGSNTDIVECGISFFNTIKNPKTVTAALLVANGEIYPLEDITALFANSETHELRINAVVSRQSLEAALKAETLYLVANLDRVEYQFEPEKNFAAHKRQLLKKFF